MFKRSLSSLLCNLYLICLSTYNVYFQVFCKLSQKTCLFVEIKRAAEFETFALRSSGSSILILFPVAVIPCRETFNWGINRWSSNLKVPTLDIKIKGLRLTIYTPKFRPLDALQRNWVLATNSNFLIPLFLEPNGVNLCNLMM